MIAFDQPLFAIAKQLQWNNPDAYGEAKFVIMFGGLHIKLAILKVLGCWLDESGWNQVLVDANVASSGTAESFLSVSHITKTRRAHQVTMCALYILLRRAFNDSGEDNRPTDVADNFTEWCEKREAESPLFKFWFLTLQLQISLCLFVRSLRKGDFKLYISVLTHIIPWFFAMDRINYSRWLPIHLRDMTMLHETHPEIADEFQRGNFVIRKSDRPFSSMPIDQAHEQNNALVKGEGGAVGLTENPSALRRWMVAGPEMARMVSEFEQLSDNPRKSDPRHHEDHHSFQVSFTQDVANCVVAFEERQNPFADETGDLIRLHTKEVLPVSVVKTVKEIEEVGSRSFESYVQNRLASRNEQILKPIKKLKLPLMNTRPPTVSKTKNKLSALRSDCNLFSRLYVGCETRGADLDEFFRHENQTWPPSLSECGVIRKGCKSDIVSCFEEPSQSEDEPSSVNVILLDAAVIVNMLRPGEGAKTFGDYAEKTFSPYVKSQLTRAPRVDLVWDVYKSNSLKAHTRQTRGSGTTTRVARNTPLPRQWQKFLRSDENKTQLFSFLADEVLTLNINLGTVVTTCGSEARSNKVNISLDRVSPCSHEEADTRLILHVFSAIESGKSRLLVKTVDSDVLVLCIATASKHPSVKLWVEYGTGKNLRFVSAHGISATLGPEAAAALLGFHSFTGCDTVSAFATRGKKTAWKTWKSYPDITQSFIFLSTPMQELRREDLERLERFVILMYDRTSPLSDVNSTRRQLFTQKGRVLEAMPPTQDALRQHILRAAYQAGHCWGQAELKDPVLPSPGDWGWCLQDSTWKPLWMTIPDATESCMELQKCGCSKEHCGGKCKCVRDRKPCTALCKCQAKCESEY